MLDQELTSFQSSVSMSLEHNGSGNGISTNGYKETADDLLNRPKVLMYHRIVDDEDLARTQPTCVHIDDFHKQLELIDQLGYTPITLNDYRLFQAGEIQLPRKPIIITFDDGYLDTYRFAFPLMKEYGMKGVVFVIGDQSIKTNVWDDNKPEIIKASLMNSDQIVEMHNNGFEIGVHTLTHSHLTKLSEEQCMREIKMPKIILESIIGSKINSFSYPYGKVNNRVKEYVASSGYKYACSVYSGPAKFGLDPLEIRRISVLSNISIVGFTLRLVGPYEYLEWMWWKSHSKNHQ